MIADIAERASPTTLSDRLVRRFPAGPSGAATTSPVFGVLLGKSSLQDAREDAKRRLQSLYQLEPGWDSYNARQIDPTVGDLAEQLLAQMIITNFDLPAIVPKSTGGLALEWHRGVRELTLEVSTDGVIVYYFNPEIGEEWERSIADLQPRDLDEAFSAISREG